MGYVLWTMAADPHTRVITMYLEGVSDGRRFVHEAAGVVREKPVVAVLMGERMIQEAVEHFRAARVPEYRFPERAAALGVLVQQAEYLQSAVTVPEVVTAVSPGRVQTALNGFQTSGFLPQKPLHEILTPYGIPVPPVGLTQTADEAVALAEQMGYPVALKIASPSMG